MIPLMIVEDEFIIRMGLKSMVDWNKYGFEVVADASSGEKALELYNIHKPYLIILDIRMEGIDGLEVMRRIRKIDKQTKFIIISAHNEFGYAQTAIKYGVSLFLHKSKYSEDEFVDALKQISAQYSKEAVSNLVDSKSGSPKNDFYEEFLDENDSEVCDLKLNQHNLLDVSKVIIVSTYKKSTVTKQNINLLGSFIGENFRNENISFRSFYENKYVIIISDYSSPNVVKDCLKKAYSSIIKYTNSQCVFGISNPFTSSADINKCFFVAYKNCNGFLFDNEKIIFETKTRSSDSSLSKAAIIQACNNINSNLHVENFKKASDILKELIYSAASYKELESILIELIMHFEKYDPTVTIHMIFSRLMKTNDLDSIHSEFFEWAKGCVSKSTQQKPDFIDDVILYIKQNIKEDLTLKTISDHYHYSTNYLGKIFHKKTGIHITEYINDYRINKACELLTSTDMPISEISENVGISNPSYFSQLFKTKLGVSPKMYRSSQV